jgi:hypothetical protein
MMKKQFLFLFLMCSIPFFSQKKVEKDLETSQKEIEISTVGLDDFVIENSNSKFVEVILFAENMHEQEIIISEENNRVSIKFQLDSLIIEETVFRKFITKRLQRAYAIVKIPKGKNLTIYGENHSIESKNFWGDLTIYIEKGIVKLNTIQSNTVVKMYAGTIYATAKNKNITLHSNIGNITVDNVMYQKDFQKMISDTSKLLSINTIKGIIFISTQ